MVTILVGSITGTATIVADEVEGVLRELGHEVRVVPMDGLSADVFDSGGVYLICTSTYGKGNVPDNAAHLYASLVDARPDLFHVTYGVIALGDSRYAKTFCNGGRRFDGILAELGARRIGDVMFHDASSGSLAEEDAAEWAVIWSARLADALTSSSEDVSGCS